MTRPGIRAALLGAGVLAAFTPMAGSESAGLKAWAACPTCCPQSGPTCVICGTTDCFRIKDYYEGKVGPGACDLTQT
jgi:hypothetical protein